jgi:hypothetical protein
MHISRSTLGAILRLHSPHIRSDAARISFSLICTVEEGPACRFAQAGLADHTLDALAVALIDELGWKAVENAARRQVLIRCSIPDSDLSRAACECDRGDGPVIVPVVD